VTAQLSTSTGGPVNRSLRDGRIAYIVAALLATSACSGGETTGPGGPLVKTYAGELVVSGSDALSGTFVVSTSTNGAVALRRWNQILSTVAATVVKPLFAQDAEQVSGTLFTNGGNAVPLVGTATNNSLVLSGGSYTITGTAGAGGAVSGTGTAPGGLSAVVNAPVVLTTSSMPSNPTGTYFTAFTMSGFIKHETQNDMYQVIASCAKPLKIEGTLYLNVSKRSDGRLDAHIDIRWTESTLAGGSCPVGYSHSHTEYFGIDFEGDNANVLTAHRTHTVGSISSPTGKNMRGAFFIGSFSGSSIGGLISFQMNATIPVDNGTRTHKEWIPGVSSRVTLVKQ
jgi:hypothetical protein